MKITKSKKKNLIILPIGLLCITLLVILLKNTYAINPNTITLDCSVPFAIGEEYSCNITGHFSNNISGFFTDITVSDDTEILSITSLWDTELKSIDENSILLVDDEKSITGDITIANIKLKTKSSNTKESTIKLNNISLSYEEDNISKDIEVPEVIKNIQINSDKPQLSSLNVSGTQLNFQSDIFEYNIDNLDQSVITITATSDNPNNTITGDIGEQKLNYGNNKFKIVVTSKTGDTTTYTINIYRPSANASLSNLSVEGANIKFNPEKLSYDLTINSSKTTITGAAVSNTSKIEGLGEKELAYGKNIFNITVLAENGDKKVYTVNITRYDTDNTLKSLKINNQEITIDKDGNYIFTTTLDKIKIDITTNSNRISSITGSGEKELKYGANNFNITITAESGDSRVYKLIVNRLSNNKLSSLKINNENITLNDNIYNYTFEISENINKVKIEATLKDSKNKFIDGYGPRIIENINQKNTQVELKIKGQDNEEVTYIINIVKKDKELEQEDISNNIKTGVVSFCLIAIIALIALLVGIIAYRKRNKLV